MFMFMDYGLMWGELRAQMEELQEKKDSIDIEVLLAVMNKIEYLEETGDLEARELASITARKQSWTVRHSILRRKHGVIKNFYCWKRRVRLRT